jgi:hypothetical protein
MMQSHTPPSAELVKKWFSRPGKYTLIRSRQIKTQLEVFEISEKIAKYVRQYKGFLYDRLDFALEEAARWSLRIDEGKFIPFGKVYLFILDDQVYKE